MRLFGSVPIKSSVVAGRIVEFVRAQNQDEDGCRVWTESVKTILRDIGHELGFDVLPGLSKMGIPFGEFLLDVVWYSEQGGIELGAESEWQPSGVLEDFQKLVYVKAPVKVMIYWVESHAASGKKILGEIVSYMEKYDKHIEGEEYLFVAFGRGRDDRCYLYVVPKDGANRSVSFLPLQLSRVA